MELKMSKVNIYPKKNLTNSRQKYTITMTILIFFKIQKIKQKKNIFLMMTQLSYKNFVQGTSKVFV